MQKVCEKVVKNTVFKYLIEEEKHPGIESSARGSNCHLTKGPQLRKVR